MSLESSRWLFSLAVPGFPGDAEDAGHCPDHEHSGSETILLVEDEEQVRGLIQRVLSSCGYNVIAARDGNTALRIFRENGSRIGLLLVDVGLPDVRGDHVAMEFRAAFPLAQVVLMTGDIHAPALADFDQRKNVTVLQKPFSTSELSARIRQILRQ